MENRRGFTLIELLIVVVIIGILATIAIPKFASSKEKAFLATMKTDLHNLVTAEEAYFFDNSSYTTSFPATLYTVSTGITGPTISLISPTNYAAWVSSANTSKTCAVFIGATSLAPATIEGVPACG